MKERRKEREKERKKEGRKEKKRKNERKRKRQSVNQEMPTMVFKELMQLHETTASSLSSYYFTPWGHDN
jgi:ribosomal protein S25